MINKIINKKILLFILLLIFSVLPRFIFLDKVPSAINQDELHYTLDAKSFLLTGKDTLGQVSPLDVLLFNFPKSEPLQAELQYFLAMPVFGLLGFSMANLALPNALLSVLVVIMMYLIALKLFDKRVAILAGLATAINPWLIFLGRSTYEAGPATLLFLCVFYMLLIAKGRKILLVIPVSLLAFYSYIGTKLIFVPFMFLSVAYAYLHVNKRKFLKQYAILLIFSVILMLFFVFQFKQYEITRNTELLLPSNKEIVRQVIEFRNMTIQNPFLNLFDNKFSVYTVVLIKNVFNALSFNYLFVSSDYFFMMGAHGLFYYLDAVFLIIGAVWTFIRNRRLFILISLITFIGILPQVFHDPNGNGNFSPHIALIIPFFILLIAVGINQVLSYFNNKKYMYLFILGLGTLYLLAFINFSYIYLFKFPIQEATFEVQNRILSKYITLYQGKVPVTVYLTNPKLAYRSFIFYSNTYNKDTAGVINESLKNNKFVFKNIVFVPCASSEFKDSNSVAIDDPSCTRRLSLRKVSIVQLRDSGIRYNIYNDRACRKYNLSPYISNLSLLDLNIESLSPKKFCETFIISR